LAKTLVADGIAGEERLQEIEDEIDRICEAAVEFATSSPEPPLSALYDHVFSEPHPSDPHA
jgi:TPP-dependent pyruvate/acetoin dehydrogenase alpha subunit